LDEYTPTIPDAVTKYYLSTAGFETTDARVLRLVSLAAQKFVADIANDALQHCKRRGAVQATKSKSKDRKFVMTTDDLTQALSEQGITLKKPPYFT
jgi:transcription initiation factor TFIID subunit 10